MDLGRPARRVPTERRRSPRLSGHDDLTVSVGVQMSPVPVLDISAGGFAIVSRASMRQDEIYRVKFQIGPSLQIALRAKCVYCRRVAGTQSACRAGFSFVTRDDVEAAALERLIDEVTGVLSFD